MASTDSKCYPLPRGGHVVSTEAGLIQFGMPPETIKDSLRAGKPVPSIFVLLPELFDRRRGLNVSEFEFPSYYHFFLFKRKATLVVDNADVERRVREVYRETLNGPGFNAAPEEYAIDFPVDARPDHVKESAELFSGKVSIDSLVQFLYFDPSGRLQMPETSVVIKRDDPTGMYSIEEKGEIIARVPTTLSLPDPIVNVDPVPPFHPPEFGLTVLGSSHGFDPVGKTTGFVLWLNGHGVLVDPPPESSSVLLRCGIAPQTIDSVIVSHCHADHDAGTFQKLLLEGRVSVYTTPHIIGSFVRKYSALSNLDCESVRRLFHFRPVTIGAPLRLHGADLHFFYTLHAIPTVGFVAYFGGKSLAFSADTLYDPAMLREFGHRGVFTEARLQVRMCFVSERG